MPRPANRGSEGIIARGLMVRESGRVADTKERIVKRKPGRPPGKKRGRKLQREGKTAIATGAKVLSTGPETYLSNYSVHVSTHNLSRFQILEFLQFLSRRKITFEVVG